MSKGKNAIADVTFFSGVGLLGTGLWWLSPAWSLIAVGTIFVALAMVGSLRGGHGDGEQGTT